MHNKDFYLSHIDLSIGDTVYYVIGQEAVYSIKKTRIAKIDTRHKGFDARFRIDYTIYITEDGRIISRDFRHRNDELSSKQVFLSKNEAIQFIIDLLNQEINHQKFVILNAQERLAEAERVIRNYKKYLPESH